MLQSRENSSNTIGRILMPAVLRVIFAGLDNDPEEIDIHMPEMPGKFRNEGIAE